MAWTNLGYYRGWTAYWETYDHRMYAKPGGFGDTKHFHERPSSAAMARAVFRSWVDER